MCTRYTSGSSTRYGSILCAGFSLIELIIVLLITAALAAIAIPTYSDHVVRSRRSDAMTQLLRLHSDQENFFSAKGRYADATELGLPITTRYYRIGLSDSSPTSYSLLATPLAGSSQEGNGSLRISSFGMAEWDKLNDGSFAYLWEDR